MESGVDFVAVDAPYANRLMIHILAAFAEHERTLISERTRDALAAAKARGVILGINGLHLAANHKAEALKFAETLRPRLLKLLRAREMTLRSLSAELNAAGCCTRGGAAWSTSTTHRLLGRLGLTTRKPE
jgi:DNA invertase Pin-like site-specific DNA recombinase